ncbi:hypothetical protein Emag_006988 [Eimeria magna]
MIYTATGPVSHRLGSQARASQFSYRLLLRQQLLLLLLLLLLLPPSAPFVGVGVEAFKALYLQSGGGAAAAAAAAGSGSQQHLLTHTHSRTPLLRHLSRSGSAAGAAAAAAFLDSSFSPGLSCRVAPTAASSPLGSDSRLQCSSLKGRLPLSAHASEASALRATAAGSGSPAAATAAAAPAPAAAGDADDPLAMNPLHLGLVPGSPLTGPQRAQAEEVAKQRGPWLDAADPLESYVQLHGGKRVIRRILIANNGMAATKAIASLRQWAFETFGDPNVQHLILPHPDAALLTFIAMATPEDLDANAEFLKKVDAFVPVPGGPSSNNYGSVPLICETAVKQKEDAVDFKPAAAAGEESAAPLQELLSSQQRDNPHQQHYPQQQQQQQQQQLQQHKSVDAKGIVGVMPQRILNYQSDLLN